MPERGPALDEPSQLQPESGTGRRLGGAGCTFFPFTAGAGLGQVGWQA